jgi:hypothetical protein
MTMAGFSGLCARDGREMGIAEQEQQSFTTDLL